MHNLYQGGQCNPNAIGATSNQYKRMMNQFQQGNQNVERVIDHQQQGKSFEQEIKNREMMFKAMNQGWKESTVMHGQQNAMMNQQFQASMLQQQQMQKQMQMLHQHQWLQSQQRLKMQQHMLNQQFQQIRLQQQAENWQNQALMQDAFQKAEISYEEQQKNIHNSSQSMLSVMMNDTDPRFQNSQFLHFLKRIQKGELVIHGKEITEVKPDTVAMQGAFKEAQQKQAMNQQTLESEFQNSVLKHKQMTKEMEQSFVSAQMKQQEQALKAQKLMEQTWQDKLQQYENQYANHAEFQKMLQQRYMQVLNEMNLDLTQAWQAATDLQQELVHGDVRTEYIFQKNNPYLDVALPKGLALDLINQGKNNQAVLALQAHLQKNMEDGQTWRILGRILQENDQDQKSVTCFLNCLKSNPQNLDCLLSLGVSCTNTLDQVKAMYYLKQWLLLNPKYKAIQFNPNVIPENIQDQITFKVEHVKQMNQNLIDIFDQAVKMGTNDPDIYSAMAILFFIKREYGVSIDLFNKALSLDPTNYLLMNKVGATLAHLGRADQAINHYHKALDIRPNYVRVWVNLGIAYAFKGQYDEAVRFYLNALSFRPDAKHIWSYLHTCFMSLQRYDLINKISTQDIRLFMKDFDILELGQLPEPEIPYKITTQKHILNKLSQDWLNEGFIGKK